MGKKLFVVFGATGNQGNSVIEQVLGDSKLSQEYAIRGLTRNTTSPASKALTEKGVEIVKCDADSQEDLTQALKDAHTVFIVTVTNYGPNGADLETTQGKKIADVAVASGAQYLIYSSMFSPRELSAGKYKNVAHFDGKAATEKHIRSLPVKSAFFIPSSFMQNFHSMQVPRPLGDGSYGLFNIYDPHAKIPLIEIASDTGKWIAAILEEPEKFEGKCIAAATRLYTPVEQAEIISSVSGKTVRHIQVSVKDFAEQLPEGMRVPLVEMYQYINEGYYGPETEQLVRDGAKLAKGNLTELKEYLERNPIDFENAAGGH